jgi:hypothetical protein
MYLPSGRTKGVVVQNLENEVLVYDTASHKAYNLNEIAAIVFNCCDGKTTFNEIITKYNLTAEIIYLTLDELKKRNLLENGANYDSPFASLSRREVIRQVGLASMIALPAISTLIAPTVASASSRCVQPGLQPNALIRIGNFAGCFADCSAPSVTIQCCSNTARAGGICNPGETPPRTACYCS